MGKWGNFIGLARARDNTAGLLRLSSVHSAGSPRNEHPFLCRFQHHDEDSLNCPESVPAILLAELQSGDAK